MSIVKWSGATPQLNRDEFIHSIDSMFDVLWNEAFPDFGKTFGIESFKKQSYPKINAVNYSDRVEIEAAVPGMSKDEVTVEYSDGILTISGAKRFENDEFRDRPAATDGFYIYRELKESSFKRSFRLDSENLDVNNIKASFKNGILLLSIFKKKPEIKEVKKININ